MTTFFVQFFEFAFFLTSAVFLILTPFFNPTARTCFSVMSFAWFMSNLLRHKQKFYRGLFIPNYLTRYLILFVGALIFSVLFSTNHYQSQKILFDRYLMFFVFFYMGLWIMFSIKRYFYILISIFMGMSFLFGFGGIRDFIYYTYTKPAFAERLWSIFGFRIPYFALPLYLTFFIPFNFFILLLGKHRWLRMFAFINVIALSLCLLWTSSRIACFAVLLTIVPALLLIKNKKNKFLIILFAFLFMCGALLFPRTRERIKTIPDIQKWSNRLPLYQSALKIFFDYPVFGSGVGTFEKILHTPKYELPSDYPVAKELNLHAHNTYLEIAAEMGVVGLAAFILFFGAFFYHAVSLVKNSTLSNIDTAIFCGLSASIFSILIFAFGTTIIIVGPTVSTYFWFLFGMATGFLAKKKKDS